MTPVTQLTAPRRDGPPVQSADASAETCLVPPPTQLIPAPGAVADEASDAQPVTDDTAAMGTDHEVSPYDETVIQEPAAKPAKPPRRRYAQVAGNLAQHERRRESAGVEDLEWDRFKVIRVLGRGGMGVVLEAQDRALKRRVAVKVLLGAANASQHAIERFQIEGRAAARLRHPNIVAVHEVGEEAGRQFLVMDLIEGESLAERLERVSTLPLRDAAEVCQAVAEALHYAHTRAILHRDIKPGNILLGQRGPLLADFGLAKEIERGGGGPTVSGQLMGTPGYMPPEQAQGQHARIDRRADVYSLGATLYQMLVGTTPFDHHKTIPRLISAIVAEEPAALRGLRPDVDVDLETICLKCLEKDPEDRYDSAQELAEELGRYLRNEPILARRPGPLERGRKWVRRNRRLARSVASVIAVALLIGVAGSTWFAFRLDERRREAEAGRAVAERARAQISEQQAQIEAERDEAQRQRDAAEQALLERDHEARQRQQSEHAQQALRASLDHLDALSRVLGYRFRPRQEGELEDRLVRGAREEIQAVLAKLDALAAEHPTLAGPRVIQGRAWLELVEPRRALACAEHALELDPEDGAAWLLRGEALIAWSNLEILRTDETDATRAERLASARESFEIAQGFGVEPEPIARVWTQIAAEEFALADAILSRLEAATPSEETCYARAMLIYRRTRLAATRNIIPHRVLPQIEGALKLCPRMVPALYARAAIRNLLGDFQGALRDFTEVIRLKPTFPLAYGDRGHVKLGLGDLAGAVADYSLAIECDPGYAHAFDGRGWARFLQGDYTAALTDFNESLRQRPTVNAYNNRSLTYSRLGKFKLAIEDCTAILELDPTYAGALLNRGLSKLRLGDRAGAIEDYSLAIELNPEYHDAYLNRALARSDADYPLALADVDRALKVKRSAVSLEVRGTLKLHHRDMSGALADYTAALELDPNYVQAWGARGSVRLMRRDRAGAARDFEQVLRLQPNHPQGKQLRELIQTSLGRPAEF